MKALLQDKNTRKIAGIVGLIILFLLLGSISSEEETKNSNDSPTFTSSSRNVFTDINDGKEADPSNILSNITITPPSIPTSQEIAKRKILPKLPIVIENFETSVGLITNINIFSVAEDPSDAIRMEIYGIDYAHKDINPETNPNSVAFQESFLKGKEELSKNGLDTRDLTIIYGTRDYIQNTSEYWVNTFQLL